MNWDTLEPPRCHDDDEDNGDGEEEEIGNGDGEEEEIGEENLPILASETDMMLPITDRQRRDLSAGTVDVSFNVQWPKRELKYALQRSYTVQWVKRKVQWPKSLKVSTRTTSLFTSRVELELHRALHRKQSGLRAKVGRGVEAEYSQKIGDGLFSYLSYRKNDVIAEFKGTYIATVAEFNKLCEKEPFRREYSVSLTESGKGATLDCYDSYKSGKCLASLSNSPKGCFNVATNKMAVANCYLSTNATKKTAVLKAAKNINAYEELLWDYNNSEYEFNTNV